MYLLKTRSEIVEDNPTIANYVQLTDIRDRLTATLGHCPSPERWATEASIPVADLSVSISYGSISLGGNSWGI